MTTVIVTVVFSLAIAQSIFGASRFFGQGKDIRHNITFSSEVVCVFRLFR
jgi:hypothetical protein